MKMICSLEEMQWIEDGNKSNNNDFSYCRFVLKYDL